MLLKDIKGVGPVTLKKLNSLNIHNLSDLMNFLPKTYIDMTTPVSLQSADDGSFALLRLKIISVGNTVRTKRGLNFFKVVTQDCLEINQTNTTRTAQLIWFNQPYLRQNIIVGGEYFCFGKIKREKRYVELVNPTLDFCETAKKLMGILPIYKTKNLIPQQTFRSMISSGLESYFATSVVGEECSKFSLMEINTAYRGAHFPQTLDDAYGAHRRIIIEDTVKQIIYYKIYNENHKNLKKIAYNKSFSVSKMFVDSLPFKLTETQEIALEELQADFSSPFKINRILAGDVGSGKTVVAFTAMYYVAMCGYQTAIMAPTEILAYQHYQNALRFFKGFDIEIVYLSGSVLGNERERILKDIFNGKAKIVIGTHALFQKNVKFNNLSFVVIDEQHKFGVAQKYDFEIKGFSVDTLTLSATPIPRSMAMILYDELKLSVIEKANTTTVTKTYIVSDENKKKMWDFIKNKEKKGKQAYLVCPRICDSEDMELYSAETLYKELDKSVFKNLRVGLLHGRMKADEKTAVMEAFSKAELDILISTTVIEVGIDIKNATIIAVLNSERFGLSTLHQLRGRVGRGNEDAYCFLHTIDASNERLKLLEEYDDGFKLAELDFANRGGGDFLGTRQKGETYDSRYVVKLTPDIIMLSKQIAKDVLASDFTINSEEYRKYSQKFADITIN